MLPILANQKSKAHDEAHCGLWWLGFIVLSMNETYWCSQCWHHFRWKETKPCPYFSKTKQAQQVHCCILIVIWTASCFPSEVVCSRFPDGCLFSKQKSYEQNNACVGWILSNYHIFQGFAVLFKPKTCFFCIHWCRKTGKCRYHVLVFTHNASKFKGSI